MLRRDRTHRLPAPGWVLRTSARHPRAAMAVRAAVATALAWYVAQALPGPASEYPYYAPMGAVIASSTTLMSSARESLQAVGSISLGGLIGVVAGELTEVSHPGVIAMAAAAGVVASGWSVLGGMGSWVPTAALFTLIIGQGDPDYVGAFAGLTLLGALIGLLVTVLMPHLPLAPAQQATAAVRTALVDELHALADSLEQGEDPDERTWQSRHERVRPLLARMRAAVADADEARRGNFRAPRYAAAFDTLENQSRSLERVATLIIDLSELVTEQDTDRERQLALGGQLRPTTATALRDLAAALSSVTGASAEPAVIADAHRSLDTLTREVDRHRDPDQPGGGTLTAGAVLLILRRCLDSVHPTRTTEYAS
ncbi:hypothetical protein PU560_13615 [Georgenia sp. 10Sc9-8]|uniref:FUSC family protein n=1 Tax=Georgenia halotolerans TaxID=3028317 RepID=A0ABT5U0P2_9MICO|nr:hypothetical protein [Georgenia halotolerans]